MAIKSGQYVDVDGLKTFFVKIGSGHPTIINPRRGAGGILPCQLEAEYRAASRRRIHGLCV